VYVHYKSKEELLFVISQEGHQISLDRIRSDQRSETSPVRQLEAMMRGFVFDHADGHVRARVNNYELDHLSPEHFRIIAGMRREIEERFFDVIVAGQRSGEFAPGDARMMTRALISLGVDTARWFRADGMSTAADIADNYVTFALRMVAAPTMRNATSP
jgi:AcrR family transcriptional regulator